MQIFDRDASDSMMAPIKRTIATMSEDDSDLETEGSDQGSDSSQSLSVSHISRYMMSWLITDI